MLSIPMKMTNTYDVSKRVKSTEAEDKNAIDAASEAASASDQGIIGPGNPCIDVAQAAFGSLVKDRGLDDDGDVPGQSDLVPKKWFNKLDARVNEANKKADADKDKIDMVVPKKTQQ